MIESPLLPHHQNYIDGRWMDGTSGRLLQVINPATGELLAEIPEAGPGDAARAIESADKASRVEHSLEERRNWLKNIHEGLAEYREELARIITLEQGKPLAESRAEVDYGAGFFRYFSEHIEHLKPRDISVPGQPNQWRVYYRPAGVAALITPWNFPLAMFGKKFAPSIATGCGSVTKPASQTPLTAIAVHTLAERAGLPPGQANLVMGPGSSLGPMLCSHPSVRIISCTGSTETGKTLLRLSADHVKKTALELGGNAAFIVLEDANLDVAADSLMINKFRCAGQTCVCANRVFVHETVIAGFRKKLVDRLSKLAVGNGMDPSVQIGPLIDSFALRKVKELVDDAVSQGARITFGSLPEVPGESWGAFCPPILLEDVTDSMAICQEEIFGPVVSILAFRTEEEVIRRADSTPYGLAGYLFTGNPGRAERLAAQIRCGHIGVNTGSGPVPDAPFGGMKQSGLGREGGLEGLFEYTEPQTVVSRS